MARVETYRARRLRVEEADSRIRYLPVGKKAPAIAVVWASEEPWLAATVYLRRMAFEIAATGGSFQTVIKHAAGLAAYATFLESENLAWDYFPEDKSQRPTYQYRGHLLQRCEKEGLARSTASNHISVLRRFYAWAMHSTALDDPNARPYEPRNISVRYANSVGLIRAKSVISSDLAIKRPKVERRGVEEGCSPIRMADRDSLLKICAKHFRVEFNLFMKLGFFTGIRNGSIINLTHRALRDHFPSPDIPGWFAISIGPKYGIPTKGGVNYYPSIPGPLLTELLAYCKSTRRARRVKKAAESNRDLIFLGSRGQKLNNRSFSMDMTSIRRIAKAKGVKLKRFYFHCTRATFGTAFVLACLKAGLKSNDIYPRLMRLMGHADASTSMGYIDFVENDEVIEADMQAFREFLSLPELVLN